MRESSTNRQARSKVRSFSFSVLDQPGFLREKQILGDSKADPPIPAIIPVGRTTWWEGVKSGKYPPAYKLSERCTAWKTEDIRELIARLSTQSEEAEDSKDQPDNGDDEDESE